MLRRRGDFARENEPPVNGAARAAHYFLIGARCGALNANRRALGYAAFDIPFQESSMTIRANLFYAALLAGAATFAAMPAQALTAQECSAKYQAAKSAGTLGDQKWNDFRKAQCGADATPAAATTAVPKETPKETPKAAATPSPASAPISDAILKPTPDASRPKTAMPIPVMTAAVAIHVDWPVRSPANRCANKAAKIGMLATANSTTETGAFATPRLNSAALNECMTITASPAGWQSARKSCRIWWRLLPSQIDMKIIPTDRPRQASIAMPLMSVRRMNNVSGVMISAPAAASASP